MLSLKHKLRIMRAQGSGSIVNISSAYGHEGAAGAAIYAASKHAVEGLTKSVAIEVAASGVRVNAVAPGPTDTGMLDRFTGGDGENLARDERRLLGSDEQDDGAGDLFRPTDTLERYSRAMNALPSSLRRPIPIQPPPP